MIRKHLILSKPKPLIFRSFFFIDISDFIEKDRAQRSICNSTEWKIVPTHSETLPPVNSNERLVHTTFLSVSQQGAVGLVGVGQVIQCLLHPAVQKGNNCYHITQKIHFL